MHPNTVKAREIVNGWIQEWGVSCSFTEDLIQRIAVEMNAAAAPSAPSSDNAAFIYAATLKLAVAIIKDESTIATAVAALEKLVNANGPVGSDPPTSIQSTARKVAERWFALEEAKHYAAFNLPVPRSMPPESFTAQRLKKKVDELAAIITSELAATSVETDAVVGEVTRRMDAVVDAAVAWHQGDEQDWQGKSEALENAIDELLELRSPPLLVPPEPEEADSGTKPKGV